MSDFRDVTFGEHLFSRIDDNVYLQKLYHNILINYSRRLFHLDEMEEQPVNIGDALTFADVLSKSCGTNLSDIHKTRAQEMVALLYDMYPKDEQVKYYLGSVLASTGNFLGMNKLTPDFENASLLERVFMHFNMDYLSVPSDGGARFFPAQKEIYDSLSRPYFSYSAPTSMGKSFMMRAFIKQQIVDGAKKNFALLIPTKALINEVTSELIESLTTLLKETDYRIVTSSGSMALETKHNYIFVLTPERMLYILIDDPDLKIDYLFVDEAHKISSGDKRSAFYYKVINKLGERHSNAHIIFASPNIPNPGIYLDTLSMGESTIGEGSIVACRYAPVSQLKYIVDLWERNIRVFDSYSKKFILLHEMSRQYSLSEVIARIGDKRHNIVYCKSKNDAIYDISTEEGDIVLDFFGGSGTSAAVAHKMKRQYILCEQMDYIETFIVKRLERVVDGEDGGISKEVDWQGGGSFVYCELAKLNQTIVEEIEASTDDTTLSDIYGRMVKSGFISYKVNPADIDAAADDYAALSLNDKKRFLMEILDKNLLYVNYCDIDDEEFGISDEDKAFTRSFYREG